MKSNLDGLYIDSQSENTFSNFTGTFANVLINIFQFILIFFLILALLHLFVTPINIVSGVSMVPNFCNGDIYITYKLSSYLENESYKHGDVIAFKGPDGNPYIKRVIGLPGDKISIMQGKVYRNGSPIDEKYLPSDFTTTIRQGSFLSEGQTIIIPKNKYFVLGDNRSVSLDSRDFGNIDKYANSINGKVILVVWPLSRFRVFDPLQSFPKDTCDDVS